MMEKYFYLDSASYSITKILIIFFLFRVERSKSGFALETKGKVQAGEGEFPQTSGPSLWKSRRQDVWKTPMWVRGLSWVGVNGMPGAFHGHHKMLPPD